MHKVGGLGVKMPGMEAGGEIAKKRVRINGKDIEVRNESPKSVSDIRDTIDGLSLSDVRKGLSEAKGKAKQIASEHPKARRVAKTCATVVAAGVVKGAVSGMDVFDGAEYEPTSMSYEPTSMNYDEVTSGGLYSIHRDQQ